LSRRTAKEWNQCRALKRPTVDADAAASLPLMTV
jgi:hypothetical protein